MTRNIPISILSIVPEDTKHPGTWLIEHARRAGVQTIAELAAWLRTRTVIVQAGGRA